MTKIQLINLNNYEIIEQIGYGSNGKVFLIQERSTGKQFAAKESLKEYSKEDEYQDFNKEILSLSRVQNIAILKIYGYSLKNFQELDYPVIIMEYMANSSLDKALNTNPTSLTLTQKYIILLGLSIGIRSLHSQGIIHRDLKPANILLDEQYYPHICDFGISYISDLELSQIIMNTVIGTPLYQAPEVLKDESYNYKVDVYSFSLIAYQIITGEKPFKNYHNLYKLQTNIINGHRPDTSMIKDFYMKNFLELCWSPISSIRPSFDDIFEEILSEKYQNFFGVSKEKVEEYLSLFDDELKAKKSLPTILNDLLSKAKSGNSEALFRLAVIYDEGEEGVEIDKNKACEFYQKACDLGNQDAMITYGRKLMKGDGIQIDKEKAAEIYKKFADNGNDKAMNNYGLMLYFGDGIEQNKEEAARYLKMAVDEGNPRAMLKYGDMLFYGDGVKTNKKEAAKYYKLSAEKGCNKALFNYGLMLFYGDGIKANKDEAAHYIKTAAEHGVKNAREFYIKNISSDSDIHDSTSSFDSDDKIIDPKIIDLSCLRIANKRITCPLFLEVKKACNINTAMINDADFILYDGPMRLIKYCNYDPSKHLCKIPGLTEICRKTNFFKSLYQMKIKYPDKYKYFVPITFQLPEEEKQFQEMRSKTQYKNIPWILKRNNNGKKGIIFIPTNKKLDETPNESIIQPFISPYLINGHKFDLRIYVMITNLEPLTLYIYNQCIAYVCQERFTSPTIENRNSYYFPKKDLKYDEGEDKIEPVQYARSIIRRISHNSEDLWHKIKEISSLSIISIYEEMKGIAIEACANNDKEFATTSSATTELIPPLNRFMNVVGLDILIDETGTPNILGINDNPGMKPINEIDKQFKSELIQSEFELIAFLLNKTTSESIKWSKILPTNNLSINNIIP